MEIDLELLGYIVGGLTGAATVSGYMFKIGKVIVEFFVNLRSQLTEQTAAIKHLDQSFSMLGDRLSGESKQRAADVADLRQDVADIRARQGRLSDIVLKGQPAQEPPS